MLDLGQNHIEVIPEEFCNCTGLTSLDLQHNDITELPANIGNLRNLKRLGLRYALRMYIICDSLSYSGMWTFCSSLLSAKL